MCARRQALGSLRKIGVAGAGLALSAALLGSTAVESASPKATSAMTMPWPTLPVRDVRAGMTGYGLTVFSGQKPERFPIRVVGVLPKHTSLMDIILVEMCIRDSCRPEELDLTDVRRGGQRRTHC